MKRRTFLNGVIKGGLVALVGNLDIATLGCGVTRAEVKQHQNAYKNSLSTAVHHLREDEYVVPNSVLNAYHDLSGRGYYGIKHPWESDIKGMYHDNNHLHTELREKFTLALEHLGLSPSEIAIYQKLFSLEDIIFVAESTVRDGTVSKVLTHERVHKYLKQLSNSAYSSLQRVARDLVSREYTLEQAKQLGIMFEPFEIEAAESVQRSFPDAQVKLPFVDSNNPKERGYTTAAKSNFEELYARLAQGDLHERVEKALRIEFPRSYEIYCHILEHVKR